MVVRYLLAPLLHFWSRFFGIIILPAQLPGDVVELAGDLLQDPWHTARQWSWATVRRLLWQIFTARKVTLDNDPLLVRLQKFRNRYAAHGWQQLALTTADGVALDGMLRPPPPEAAAAPRYVVFIGGNFQKYEEWLSYFETYAKDGGVGFLCFNFRGVARSEGTHTARLYGRPLHTHELPPDCALTGARPLHRRGHLLRRRVGRRGRRRRTRHVARSAARARTAVTASSS